MSEPVEAPSDRSILAKESGIGFPNGHPYSHITFTCVVWNDAARLGPLLEYVRPWFDTIAVAVQSSPDDTLEVARQWADIVVEDRHQGYGDASFGPLLLPRVTTRWALKLDADEWPSTDLLESLSTATWWAEHWQMTKGVWIPFRSWVDGIEYEEQHGHLRLFHPEAGWPSTLHSRPPIDDGMWWPIGHINHARSLDELVKDYLRYYEIGRGNAGWDAHNRMMIWAACTGTAEKKGWDYVKGHSWWPKAAPIVEGYRP